MFKAQILKVWELALKHNAQWPKGVVCLCQVAQCTRYLPTKYDDELKLVEDFDMFSKSKLIWLCLISPMMSHTRYFLMKIHEIFFEPVPVDQVETSEKPIVLILTIFQRNSSLWSGLCCFHVSGFLLICPLRSKGFPESLSLDCDSPQSYRRVSNPSFLSTCTKVIGTAVADQLMKHLN